MDGAPSGQAEQFPLTSVGMANSCMMRRVAVAGATRALRCRDVREMKVSMRREIEYETSKERPCRER
eukprot:5753923-Prymnesium_polylepis.1